MAFRSSSLICRLWTFLLGIMVVGGVYTFLTLLSKSTADLEQIDHAFALSVDQKLAALSFAMGKGRYSISANKDSQALQDTWFVMLSDLSC